MITKNYHSALKKVLGCHVEDIRSSWDWVPMQTCFVLSIGYTYNGLNWYTFDYFNKPPTVRYLRKLAKRTKRDYYKHIRGNNNE